MKMNVMSCVNVMIVASGKSLSLSTPPGKRRHFMFVQFSFTGYRSPCDRPRLPQQDDCVPRHQKLLSRSRVRGERHVCPQGGVTSRPAHESYQLHLI